MTNIIYIITLLFVLPITVVAQKFDYKIVGEIKGLGNDTLVLGIIDNPEAPKTLIKIAGKNDQFEYVGNSEKPKIVFAQTAKKSRNGNFTFFIDKGIIYINGDVTNMQEVRVSGTPINDDYGKKTKVMNDFYARRAVAYTKAKALAETKNKAYIDAMTLASSITDSIFDFQKNTIKKYPNTMFSAMQLYLIADKLSGNELEEYYLTLKSPGKDLKLLEKIPGKIIAKKANKIGNLAADFNIIGSDGKVHKLSDFKGKYLLLDFWASWCVPCRQKSPGLIKVYQKYAGKDFEILSISTDKNKKNWLKAIEDDKLPWLQACDLVGPNTAIARSYGVQPIPDNFLIDPTGKIIAKGIFGEELDRKLEKLIPKKL